jgi:hypothetical protein
MARENNTAPMERIVDGGAHFAWQNKYKMPLQRRVKKQVRGDSVGKEFSFIREGVYIRFFNHFTRFQVTGCKF